METRKTLAGELSSISRRRPIKRCRVKLCMQWRCCCVVPPIPAREPQKNRQNRLHRETGERCRLFQSSCLT
ncbi:hypothetical protein GBAR_LOCUS23587 [Geodia barretti]|uniref:Uncharacterized protein n=1 Tax=Geodia barretti TaxID=519541 RepID=A0AA35T749_GEOBA|nr:hypothetical protein GBAR_LOCUS23587 [Geodia barretti]